MYFTFNQNNSGGTFDLDKEQGITYFVIIEADDFDDANDRAENIGLYFDGIGDCPCCGDRWHKQDCSEDGTEVPNVYERSPAEYVESKINSWMEAGYGVAVHHKSGKVDWY